MEITITFKGKLNDPGVLCSFCEELSNIARVMNWRYQILDNVTNPSHITSFDKNGSGDRIKGHLPLKGRCLHIHPETGSLFFYFDHEGNILNIMKINIREGTDKPRGNDSGSNKTECTPASTYRLMIKLLRYINLVYECHLSIQDEGIYWETGDDIVPSEKKVIIQKMIYDVRTDLEKGFSGIKTGNSREFSVSRITDISTEKNGSEKFHVGRIPLEKRTMVAHDEN